MAYRSGVREILLKPAGLDAIAALLETLSTRLPHQDRQHRDIWFPSAPPLPGELPPPCHERQTRTACAVTHVRAHFVEPITVAQAARLCTLSRSQFSRLFRQEQGQSFQEFLIRHRIHEARQLLHDRRISVSEAALAVGFGDLSDFARLFRRYVGVLPSHYRRHPG